MQVTSYAKWSTGLADSLVKLQRAGGLSLVFLFLGSLFVLLGNVTGRFQTTTLAFGMLLLAGSFALFVFLHLQGPVKAVRTLRENQETIDSLQELALELTLTAQLAQGFALRYASELATVVERASPILLAIPGLGPTLRQLKLDKVPELSNAVVTATAEVEGVVKDVERALRSADFSVLRQYAQRLRELKGGLRGLISGLSTVQ